MEEKDLTPSGCLVHSGIYKLRTTSDGRGGIHGHES